MFDLCLVWSLQAIWTIELHFHGLNQNIPLLGFSEPIWGFLKTEKLDKKTTTIVFRMLFAIDSCTHNSFILLVWDFGNCRGCSVEPRPTLPFQKFKQRWCSSRVNWIPRERNCLKRFCFIYVTPNARWPSGRGRRIQVFRQWSWVRTWSGPYYFYSLKTNLLFIFTIFL